MAKTVACSKGIRQGGAEWYQGLRFPVPSREENFTLGIRLQAAKNAGDSVAIASCVAELMERNLPLVMSIAKKFAKLTNVEFHDLVHYGALGLQKAITKWDPHKSALSTFAKLPITQTISRCLTDEGHTIRVPAHVARHLGRIAEWEAQHGKFATAEDLKRKFGISEQLGPALLEARRPIISVEAQSAEVEERVVTSSAGDPHLITALRQAVERLPEDERKLIELLYGLSGEKPCSLTHAARTLKLSKVCAEDLQQKAEISLRRLLKERDAA